MKYACILGLITMTANSDDDDGVSNEDGMKTLIMRMIMMSEKFCRFFVFLNIGVLLHIHVYTAVSGLSEN